LAFADMGSVGVAMRVLDPMPVLLLTVAPADCARLPSYRSANTSALLTVRRYCAIQFGECTVILICKQGKGRKVPPRGRRANGRPPFTDHKVQKRASVCGFSWGPEKEEPYVASHLGEEEIAAMVSAVEEDGWGAWVG